MVRSWPMSFLNPANLLSLSRIPMAGAVWIEPGQPWLLVPLGVAAAVTDWLDGLVARRQREHTGPHDTGAWLDPACDKLFVVSAIVSVWVAARPDWWIVALLLVREALVVPMMLVYRLLPEARRRDIDLRAGKPGKATTVTQFFAVAALMLWPEAVPPLAVLAGVLGVLAGLSYALRLRRGAG
jgi:cardiolipin synthase (CMP-forming)